jgi:hypothetical protein
MFTYPVGIFTIILKTTKHFLKVIFLSGRCRHQQPTTDDAINLSISYHDTFVQQVRQLILAKRQQKAAPLTDSQQPEKSVDDEKKPTETVTVDDRITASDITANHIEGPESLQEENRNNTEVGSPSVCDIRTQKQKTAPTEEEEKVQVDEEETQCGQEQPSTIGKPAVVHLPKRIIRNQPGTIVISGGEYF